jgi:hypothetical protein
MAGKVGNIALLHTMDDRCCTGLLDFFYGGEVLHDFYNTPFLVKDPGKTV